jgi:hypothetical protein
MVQGEIEMVIDFLILQKMNRAAIHNGKIY